MSQTKSPFILIENVLDRQACNQIITSLSYSMPNKINDNPAMTLAFNKLEEIRLQPLIDDLLDYSEPYYEFETKRLSSYHFEWYPEGYQAESIKTDAHLFEHGKWIKYKETDFTILLSLSDEIVEGSLENDRQHVGGSLQFPTHQFTLHLKVGDLLMMPSDRHFLYNISNVTLGNMFLCHIMVTSKIPYKYNRHAFNGTFKDWF